MIAEHRPEWLTADFVSAEQVHYDLRALVRCLAYADQHPQIWESLPRGSKQATEARIRGLRAILSYWKREGQTSLYRHEYAAWHSRIHSSALNRYQSIRNI